MNLPTGTHLTRRGLLGLGLGLGATAALAACGADDTSSGTTTPAAGGTGSGAASGATSSSAAGAGTFPARVTDTFGTVTIESQPKRVLSLGYSDHDVLLALGVVPIGVTQFVPYFTKGVGVWAEDKLRGTTPALFKEPWDYEKIASLTPDLISNVSSSGDKSAHDKLSQIATEIDLPQGAAPYGASWQDTATLVSEAMGRPADGKRLIDDAQAVIDKAAKDNPGFQGKTVSVLYLSSDLVGVYTVVDTRMQVLTGLGLVPSDYVKSLGKDEFYVKVSPEQLSKVDADVVVAVSPVEGATRKSMIAMAPQLATLPAAKAGHLITVEDYDITMALSAASVLSIPFAVKGIVPLLQKAAA